MVSDELKSFRSPLTTHHSPLKNMFCPKCGTQNVQTVRFCRSCGANLGNVSEALAGKPIGVHQSGFETLAEIKAWNKKNKPVNYESAITKMFTGLAFLIVAAVLGITGIAGGQFWWFWMLIPAFGSLGSGVAQYVQLKKTEKQNAAFTSNVPNALNSNYSNAGLPPPSANQYELQNLINADRKIEAIKVYREIYGVGLKEAKDAVEAMQSGQLPLMPQPETYSQPSLDQVRDLLNSGNKITAIKIYREIYNVGLKEAKDAVEAMERGQSPVNYDVPPPRGSAYDTGELAAPPSVTENTTRHLELNSEGETMNLPKK